VYIIAGDNAMAYEVNKSNLNTVRYAPEIIIITVAGPIIVDTIKAPERSRLINITGISIFFKFTSTSLFTGDVLYQNLNNFHEYLIQHSLKSRGTKDHFKWIKVHDTAPY
jgi:hypothetical protein